jgi:hypothetical protein
MHFFVELGHQFRRSVLFEPGVTGIANNLQEPSPGITPVKAIEKAVGTQHRLLYNIFGVGPVSQYPPGQIDGAVQMRQHDSLKPNSVLRL